MFFACDYEAYAWFGVLADVSSVSPSSEQTKKVEL